MAKEKPWPTVKGLARLGLNNDAPSLVNVVRKVTTASTLSFCRPAPNVRPQKSSSNFVFDKFQLEDIIAERMQPELLPSEQCCHKKCLDLYKYGTSFTENRENIKKVVATLLKK